MTFLVKMVVDVEVDVAPPNANAERIMAGIIHDAVFNALNTIKLDTRYSLSTEVELYGVQ